MDASALALLWAGILAFAILVYIVLDGFDFGVGILFGMTRDRELRSNMMDAIGPVWNGNETWLVLIATILYAAFPKVYAVGLAAFYFPAMLLLFGLIFRGVAFEFRHRTHSHIWIWDWGFCLGSTLVAFVIGTAIGALIEGVPMKDGVYVGGPYFWLSTFPLLCGLGLIVGFPLLGAGWLVFKCEGRTREWAYARLPWLASATLAIAIAALLATLDGNPVAMANLEERIVGKLFPWLAVLSLVASLIFIRRRRDALTFFSIVAFFLSIYVTLVSLFWPFLMPYTITIADAASPDSSLEFFLYAGVVVLPVIIIYTVYSYWIFRGKIRTQIAAGSYNGPFVSNRDSGGH